MKHCDKCSKCCEVIMLDNVSPESLAEKFQSGRIDPLYIEILKPISREEAFKRNPVAVSEREESSKRYGNGRDKVYFYSCPKLVDGMCSIYEKRPSMCSTYPFKNDEWLQGVNAGSHAWLSKRQYVVNEPRYSENCSYLPGLIPIRNIG